MSQRPRVTGNRLAVSVGLNDTEPIDRLAFCSEGCGAEVYLVPHDLKSSGDYIHHPVDADDTLARPVFLAPGWALGVSHYLTCKVRAQREEERVKARRKNAKKKRKSDR